MKHPIRVTFASAAVLAVVVGGFAGITSAASPTGPAGDDDGVVAIDEGQPNADEIELFNAETDAIVAYLAEKGFTVEVTTDDDGMRFLDLSDDTPDEVLAALDQYYIDQYNAETDALVAYLAEKGFTVETATDDEGYRDINLPDDASDELIEAMNTYLAETYGEDVMMIDDWEPTAEEIAEFNAETDAIVKFLADKGITIETVTDEDGWKALVLDENTPEEVWSAIEEYLIETYGDEPILYDDMAVPAAGGDATS